MRSLGNKLYGFTNGGTPYRRVPPLVAHVVFLGIISLALGVAEHTLLAQSEHWRHIWYNILESPTFTEHTTVYDTIGHRALVFGGIDTATE
jgi:hypothetical protein